MSRTLLLIPPLAMLLFAVCTASNTSSAQEQATQVDESKEPPLKYTLKVGDRSIDITEGETTRVVGTFNSPEVTLTAQAFRVFPYQGIWFKYPRSFGYEADLDDVDCKNWILSGNDFKIMYFVLSGQLSTGDYADNMMSQFGRKNCTVSNATPLKLADKTLSGTSVNATIAGSQMVLDIYRVPSTGTQTKLLVLQDSLDDSGNRSIEGKAARDLLCQSAKLDP